MALTYYLDEDGINFIPVTVDTPLPVTGGGGGGGGSTTADGEYVVGPRNLSPGDKSPLLLNKDGLLLVNLAMFVGDGQPYATFLQPVTDAQLRATPISTVEHQGNIISGPLPLTAATAATIIGAFADRRGIRVLNYIEAPVYLAYGTTGTPLSGAGSDFIPAAIGGVPGQWECPFAPVGGMRAVCASAGSLTVTVW